ncbi:hypothetical protein NE865_15208 [Phthorimaea operculella]|nr:hypothetical protein NE865_15208 [Phthorimaea operculella]
MKLHGAIVYIIISNISIIHAKVASDLPAADDKPRHVTASHVYYTYHPPKHIAFLCANCVAMSHYPVYHGTLPTYVYRYRESNTRFAALLTGLALYNLGRSMEYWNRTHYYTIRADEKCSLQVIDRSHFEETTFPCFMMSSFLEQPELKGPDVITFDVTTAYIQLRPFVEDKTTVYPIEVSKVAECVMWHNTTDNKERNVVPCLLLKEYSYTMKPLGVTQFAAGVPVYIWVPTLIALILILAFCGQSCFKKKNDPVTIEGVIL